MSRVGSIVLLLVGVVFLLNNLGVIRLSQIGGLIHTWWPLILICFGILGLMGKRK